MSLRDNDTPGVYVTQVVPTTSSEDNRTIAIEGSIYNGVDYTGLDDQLLVQLQKDPGVATIRIKITMDAATQKQVILTSADPRFKTWTHFDANPLRSFTYYTIDFDTTNWNAPVVIDVKAYDDGDNEDPFTAVVRFDRDNSAATNDFTCLPVNPATLGDVEDVDYRGCNIDHDGSGVGVATDDPNETYVFPNLRSGPGSRRCDDHRRRDRRPHHHRVGYRHRRPEVRRRPVHDPRSGRRHVPDSTHQAAGSARRRRPLRNARRGERRHPDGRPRRRRHRIDSNGNGLLDVGESLWNDDGDGAIEGDELVGYEIVGGDVPSQRFLGNVIVTGTTITRANGSELGSFSEEGFQIGQRIRTSFTGAAVFVITGVTDDVLTIGAGGPHGWRVHRRPDQHAHPLGHLGRPGDRSGA